MQCYEFRLRCSVCGAWRRARLYYYCMLCMCTFTSANTALDMSAELPVAEDDAAVVGLEEARLCASKQKRYEFVRSLGQGAFGVVLLARDLESQGGRREVAVKIIKAKGSVLQSLFGSRPSQVRVCKHGCL